jgi:hypothetical protein
MSENADKSPVDQVADLFVYAPIGWFFEAPKLLPKLAEQGRVHTRNARLFGQFAVKQGEAEVRRRLAGFEEQASGLLRGLGLLPDDRTTTNGAEAPASAPTSARSPRAQQAAPQPTEPGPAADDLAITDYDSLSASHVVTRLPGLTLDELEAVREYEVAHRGRKTILNKIAQLQS